MVVLKFYGDDAGDRANEAAEGREVVSLFDKSDGALVLLVLA